LASQDDLEALFNLLISFKDQSGRYPVFTANCLVANPDFARIKESNYTEYYYELLTDTFKKYPNHHRNWEIWQKAAEEGLFFLQSHGREHLNVQRFLFDLTQGNEDASFSFELEMPGIFSKNKVSQGNQYIVPLEFYSDKDRHDKAHIISDGLDIFETLFGYKSKSFIAGNFTWDSEVEKILFKKSVKYIQGSKNQLVPKGYYSGFHKIRHTLGENNIQKQTYLIRNVEFEPSANPDADYVNKCLKEIEISFRMGKPAIISSHRINYVGFIDEANRDRSLNLLNKLLIEIFKRWPDIEFMTSVELGELINTNEK
jgi:hypothetical protein